jgi:nucleotide-binding universal stress UspA family protein
MNGPIICGVDDSESAKGAARVARELSTQLGSPLVFVRVVDDGLPDEKITAVAARLKQLAASVTEVDCGAHWRVELGHPADRLVAVAEEKAASLIVVGSTGPRSSLLGSISADVSRRAPCPVVVVAPASDISLTNGNRRATVGGNGPATGFDAAWGSRSSNGDPGHDPEARGFAGGIVRFGIGSGES